MNSVHSGLTSSFTAFLVKEEYLYLLVPFSQSERHSKAQETSLASKMKILNSFICMTKFMFFIAFAFPLF